MLVLFALLAAGLFALLAVAADLGLARVTADQMRVATESAALEGLRWRDVVSDDQRRLVAARFVDLAFDDDLQPSNGDAIGYGIGPDLQVIGDGDLQANGQLVVGVDRVLDPEVQPNVQNLPHGDLVAGTYLAAAQHDETDAYARSDFQVAPPGTGGREDAFLVRLRRTGDPRGLDRIAGVSSAGPPLPWTFGLGALIDPASRGRGITVRGTGIATVARVLAVSTSAGDPAVDLPPLPGMVDASGAPAVWPALSFHGDPDLAGGLAVAASEVFEIEDDGTGRFLPRGGGADRFAWAVAVTDPDLPRGPAEVGTTLQPVAASVRFPPVGTAQELTVSMHRGEGGAMRRIGFRSARLEVVQADPVVLRVTPSPARIALRGATAVRPAVQARLLADPLLALAHHALPESLLAPVLGR